jgi:hypothetical protein
VKVKVLKRLCNFGRERDPPHGGASCFSWSRIEPGDASTTGGASRQFDEAGTDALHFSCDASIANANSVSIADYQAARPSLATWPHATCSEPARAAFCIACPWFHIRLWRFLCSRERVSCFCAPRGWLAVRALVAVDGLIDRRAACMGRYTAARPSAGATRPQDL